MEKIKPIGPGIWIAYGNMIKGGVDGIINASLELGMLWIAPRLGDGGWRDTWFTPSRMKELCEKAHKNNLKVFPWQYIRPNRTAQELILWKNCVSEGADGLILNAEVQYKNEFKAAANCVSVLRKEFPDMYISNAPFALIGYHGDYPYVQFGELDSSMPQLYNTEFNTERMSAWSGRMDKQWEGFYKKNPKSAICCPIAATYGKKELKVPPGDIKVEDIQFFIERYKDRECYSFYTLEVMNKDVYAYLKQLEDNRKAQEVLEELPEEKIEPVKVEEPAKVEEVEGTEDEGHSVSKLGLTILPPEPVETKPEENKLIVKDKKSSILAFLMAIINVIMNLFKKKK